MSTNYLNVPDNHCNQHQVISQAQGRKTWETENQEHHQFQITQHSLRNWIDLGKHCSLDTDADKLQGYLYCSI